MTTQEQLDNFHRFASERIANGMAEMSLPRLLDLWARRNPSPREHAANVEAIREAIEAMKAGDRGRAAEEVLEEVCEDVGLNLDAGTSLRLTTTSP